MEKTTTRTRRTHRKGLSYEATQLLYGISVLLTFGIVGQIAMHM